MKILAIERFTDQKYLIDSDMYLEENHMYIEQLYRAGKIKLCWSQSNNAGNVLIIDAVSVQEAKEILKSSPLVKSKIITYNVITIKNYEFDNSYSVEKNNFVLVYASAQARELESYELQNILKVARSRNSRMQITGMLLYQNGSFLQVLEGDRENVEELFYKIEKDSRHTKVVKVSTFYTAKRVFYDWSMGYADVTQKELEFIQGLNNFFEDDNTFINLKEEHVQNILSAFKDGKWRQHIS